MTVEEKVRLFDKLCYYADSMSKEEMSRIIKEWIDKNLGECWIK